MSRLRPFLLAVAVAGVGCASALQPLDPESDLGRVDPALVDEARAQRWLGEAVALFAQRPDVAAVEEAESLFLRAAQASPAGIEALLGAAEATIWLARHLEDGGRRDEKARQAVQTAQWCEIRKPGQARCSYWLALALGVQADERRSTAVDGLKRMVEQLELTIERDADLDYAGAHRVMARVLVRAPGWPTGPGDPDTGLEHAEIAARAYPDYPPNQIALGEAYRGVDERRASRNAFERAGDLARVWQQSGHPDAAEWLQEVAVALAELG